MTELTVEDFKPYEGRTVRLKDFDFTLKLSAVEGGDGPLQPGSTRAPFLLVLSGPKQPLVRPGSYMCDIEDGPSYELFLLPIHTAAADRQDYQSVFG